MPQNNAVTLRDCYGRELTCALAVDDQSFGRTRHDRYNAVPIAFSAGS